jgi:hypothetical protein
MNAREYNPQKVPCIQNGKPDISTRRHRAMSGLPPLSTSLSQSSTHLIKTMKNKILIVTMMTLMVLALAGCGEKSADNSPATPNAPASPPAPAMTNSTGGQTPPAGTNQ